jgi:TRAP-type mannitol/chloroaromatic compound transport system substrate-binding protein
MTPSTTPEPDRAQAPGGRQDQAQAFPKDVMDAGFKASMEVFAEHEAKSPEFKKIHQDMRAFQRDQMLWNRFSEYPSTSS